MPEQLLVSPDQAAEMLGCKRSSIYIALAAGAIKSTRLGARRKIHIDEVRRVALEGLPERPQRNRRAT